MSWIAVGVTTAVAGAGFAYQSSRQQARSLKDQALGQELEARVAELGVKQTAARRMEALVADIGAIRTMRATHNVSADSGSGIVAEKAFENESLQALRADILNQRYGIVSRKTSAASLRAGATGALTSGYAQMFTSLARGFAQFGGGGAGGGGSSVGSGIGRAGGGLG